MTLTISSVSSAEVVLAAVESMLSRKKRKLRQRWCAGANRCPYMPPLRDEQEETPPALTGPDADPISYLAAGVRGSIKPSGLSSLGVNMTVVEILDAAHKSAKAGKRVELK